MKMVTVSQKVLLKLNSHKMDTNENKFHIKQVADLLTLIKLSNEEIQEGRALGHPENDIMIRQAKFRKQKYTTELLELLNEYQLPLQLVEDF